MKTFGDWCADPDINVQLALEKRIVQIEQLLKGSQPSALLKLSDGQVVQNE